MILSNRFSHSRNINDLFCSCCALYRSKYAYYDSIEPISIKKSHFFARQTIPFTGLHFSLISISLTIRFHSFHFIHASFSFALPAQCLYLIKFKTKAKRQLIPVRRFHYQVNIVYETTSNSHKNQSQPNRAQSSVCRAIVISLSMYLRSSRHLFLLRGFVCRVIFFALCRCVVIDVHLLRQKLSLNLSPFYQSALSDRAICQRTHE